MIKGFQGVSLIDYPEHIASIVFIGGCNFRCPFCHNIELVLPEELKKLPTLSEEYILKELIRRKNFINGVEFTGGEPTLYKGLTKFLKRIKEEVKIDIKLDTNGTNPSIIEELLEESLVDYIAMDIKSSPDNYNRAAGVKVDIDAIKKSVELIKSSQIDYEFRTTLVPDFVKEEDIGKICKFLGNVKRYVLQRYRPEKTLNYLENKPYKEKETRRFLSLIDCAEIKLLRM